MKSYTIHPAADLFPMLSDDELTILQNDIAVEGQLEPIITWNGQIIDGRNRYAACQRIGKKPRLKERSFADEDAVINYIVSTNIKRRHLTTSQRAIISEALAKLEKHSNQHAAKDVDSGIQLSAKTMTQAQAAKAMNVSLDSVKKARAISKADPVLAQKVREGEVTLNAAHKQVAPPKPKPAPVVVPDPDFAHMEDPPPLIQPAKPKHFIGPAEGEDGEAWQETQSKQTSPTVAAQKLLQQALALSGFDRGWLASELSRR